MSTAVPTPSSAAVAAAKRQRSVMMVFGCTVLGAAAQILMKIGANHLGGAANPGITGVLTNIPLMTGYCLYGLSTLLLVLALKDGELSLLYPVIALTYVWVTVASFLVFHDTVDPFRILGIIIIVAGVAVLGRASRP